jgi:2-amino-4-hydroxy-6-hydroxymethyldihydropteridine diphosphokinase
MAKMTTAYIGLGSNLGDRKGYISKALENLGAGDTQVLRTSSLIETEPVGMTTGAEFLNGVAEIETGLSAYQLLERLEQIEGTLGRDSKGEKEDRTIDLDLLLYGGQFIDSKDLTVPHPKLHLRSFVLKGLCELSPDLEHPVLAETCSELLTRLGGYDYDFAPDYPRLVSIAGVIGVGKTTLTEKLCKFTGYQPIYECYGENPFLPEVFNGNHQLALDSQLFFLVSRLQQLERKALEKSSGWVSDYIFEKEMIYAEKFLDDIQLELYKKIHSFSNFRTVNPRLVIYLADNVDNCLARIHKRGRDYEQGIKPQLLEELTENYNRLFENWEKCPVITLHLDEINITTSRFTKHLASQVQYYLR